MIWRRKAVISMRRVLLKLLSLRLCVAFDPRPVLQFKEFPAPDFPRAITDCLEGLRASPD
jgi:hypothetical protein